MSLQTEKKYFQNFITFTLIHLCLMEFPSLINLTSPFPFKGLLGGILIFIEILIEHSVGKQW